MLTDDIELVTWDVDGTLYSMPAVKRAVIFAAIRGLFSLRIARNLRELSLLGRFRKSMARARSAGGQLPDGALAERDRVLAAEHRWYRPAIEKVGVAPGIFELMDRFDRAGIRQVVVSDYRADYKLEALGLRDRFAASYAAEDHGALKPSPAVFHAVIADHHIAPERILHIGDRDDTDTIAAQAAGCQATLLPQAMLRLLGG